MRGRAGRRAVDMERVGDRDLGAAAAALARHRPLPRHAPRELSRVSDRFSQFREVPDPERAHRNAGVYLLFDGAAVVYVGSSGNVPERVAFHAGPGGHVRFDRSLWLPLPFAVLPAYEGALIRALKPKYNKRSPAGDEHDREILDGLGLGHLTTDGWREHFRAIVAAQARRRQRSLAQAKRDSARIRSGHA